MSVGEDSSTAHGHLQLVPERKLANLLGDRLRVDGREDGEPADDVDIVGSDLGKRLGRWTWFKAEVCNGLG